MLYYLNKGDFVKNKFTIDNFLSVSKKALEFQLNELYPLEVVKDNERVNLLFLNHDRNFSTFITIRYLAENKRVADIYTLSRSMFESIISMGLLAGKLIPNDIERYQDFQYIEIYKTHNHLKRLGLENLSGTSKNEEAYVSKKRADYIKKWGNSNLSWTGQSLEKNAKEVDNIYPKTCDENHFYEYLYCQVYRKGSQSAHSSFAGLSKGVNIEIIKSMKNSSFLRFRENEAHLIFTCFHSIIVFLSSVRFLGHIIGKHECEKYFQSIASYIISEP